MALGAADGGAAGRRRTAAYAVEERQDALVALAALPRGQRAVLVLRFYDDLTEAQTAEVLGVTVGTVKSQTARALKALRCLPDDEGAGMSEEQLRDVLARVVPEAPDSVADPAPVVRAARVRRRTQVALAGGAVAVIAVAAVVGGRALTDDDSGPQIADEVSISGDPYSAASCPDVLPASGPLPDLHRRDGRSLLRCGLQRLPGPAGSSGRPGRRHRRVRRRPSPRCPLPTRPAVPRST